MEIISRIYKRCFPYKEIKKFKHSQKPWVTKNLIKMINVKNSMYQLFLKNRDPDALDSFRKYRNNLTKVMKKAKCSCNSCMFEGVSGVKEMWSKLNSITALHKGNFSVKEITEGDRTYRGRALAEKLNNHLTSSVDSVSDTTALHYMSAQTVP